MTTAHLTGPPADMLFTRLARQDGINWRAAAKRYATQGEALEALRPVERTEDGSLEAIGKAMRRASNAG